MSASLIGSLDLRSRQPVARADAAGLPSPPRLEHLDLLRGTAALLVLVGHLRSYLFQDYADLGRTTLPLKAFYLATGLGHQAVIVFFALSGFLVGGKAFADLLGRHFCWRRYLLRRLTRLWIVIIPALLLTLLFDGIGLHLTGGVGYDGRYCGMYFSGPCSPAGVPLSAATFFGNLAFLQTIFVAPYGTNGPMWSLASEFWYYVVFPLAFWALLSGAGLTARVGALLLLSGLLWMLPFWLVGAGTIWVAGAAAAWCRHRKPVALLSGRPEVRVAALALLLAAMVVAKLRLDAIGDLGLGFVVAATLPVFASLRNLRGLYGVTARASSEISYTLYLTHFPLLTAIVLAGFAPDRRQLGLGSAGLFAGLLAICVLWAAIVWWCFERNTDAVFRQLEGVLLEKPRSETAARA